MSSGVEPPHDLQIEGIHAGQVCWNLSVAALYADAVGRREGVIAAVRAAGPRP